MKIDPFETTGKDENGCASHDKELPEPHDFNAKQNNETELQARDCSTRKAAHAE